MESHPTTFDANRAPLTRVISCRYSCIFCSAISGAQVSVDWANVSNTARTASGFALLLAAWNAANVKYPCFARKLPSFGDFLTMSWIDSGLLTTCSTSLTVKSSGYPHSGLSPIVSPPNVDPWPLRLWIYWIFWNILGNWPRAIPDAPDPPKNHRTNSARADEAASVNNSSLKSIILRAVDEEDEEDDAALDTVDGVFWEVRPTTKLWWLCLGANPATKEIVATTSSKDDLPIIFNNIDRMSDLCDNGSADGRYSIFDMRYCSNEPWSKRVESFLLSLLLLVDLIWIFNNKTVRQPGRRQSWMLFKLFFEPFYSTSTSLLLVVPTTLFFQSHPPSRHSLRVPGTASTCRLVETTGTLSLFHTSSSNMLKTYLF